MGQERKHLALPESTLIIKYQLMENQISKWVMVGIVNVITEEKIFNIVCRHFNVNIEDVVSRSRKRNLVNARFLITYYIRECCGKQYKYIGKLFKRDHSTAIYACEQVRNLVDGDDEFRNHFLEIGKKINAVDNANNVSISDNTKSTTTLNLKYN
jgi:chromosomal replication initiation ATPase DnaA